MIKFSAVVALAFPGLLGLAALPPATPVAPAETAAFLPFQPTNCAKCVSCNPEPGEAGHVVYLHDLGARDGSTAHTCLPHGTDACSVHGECGSSFALKNPAAAPEDVNRLFEKPEEFASAFLEKYPTLATVNLKRNALQIRGCDNDVIIGHVGLPPAVATQLSAQDIALAD